MILFLVKERERERRVKIVPDPTGQKVRIHRSVDYLRRTVGITSIERRNASASRRVASDNCTARRRVRQFDIFGAVHAESASMNGDLHVGRDAEDKARGFLPRFARALNRCA